MKSNQDKRREARMHFQDIFRREPEDYNTNAELQQLAIKCIQAVVILDQCLEDQFGPEAEDCYLEDE